MGTAGHVDHGKSSLVLALSGIDPDRLPEEKARGLTIDLGFAWMETVSGQTLGIVDVPGHERFVKNMIAGVGAIDFVLFVVAADDGWMPQTSEHLAILQYLDVERGIVVVTKKGLVDPDWLSLVQDDVGEKLKDTFLAGAATHAVDSLSGDGIPELSASIDATVQLLPVRRDMGKPRLYIDRAFAVAGRGAVVTGTLVEGPLSVGETLVIVPDQIKARVRELQIHGKMVEHAPPGQRVAVNLAGIDLNQLCRGQCLVGEDDTGTFDRLWAEVDILPEMTHPLKSERHVLVMVGTAEPEGIAYPLDTGSIAPGHRGMCELRLLEPVKGRLGDKFVLRWPTPEVTIGGGTILDTGGTRHLRRQAGFIERLKSRSRGTVEAYRETELSRDGFARRQGFLWHSPFSESEINSDLESAAEDSSVMISGVWLFDPAWLNGKRTQMVDVLRDRHTKEPFAPGLNLAQWKKRSNIPDGPMNDLVALLEREGEVKRTGDAYHLPGHSPQLPAAWDDEAKRLWTMLENGGTQPPTRSDLEGASDNARQIVTFWIANNRVVSLGDGVLFPAEVYGVIRDKVRAFLTESESMTAAQLRDLLGTTRRYAVPILEALDSEGTTRRVGDVRVLATSDKQEG